MKIDIGNLKAKVIHTPGHTFGSICLLIDENVISGDTLFAGSVGRVDLTGGTSMNELVRSIKTKLMVLPDSFKVYPGHGPRYNDRNRKEIKSLYYWWHDPSLR